MLLKTDSFKSVPNKHDQQEDHPQILLILTLSLVVFIVEIPYTVFMFFQIYYWTLRFMFRNLFKYKKKLFEKFQN